MQKWLKTGLRDRQRINLNQWYFKMIFHVKPIVFRDGLYDYIHVPFCKVPLYENLFDLTWMSTSREHFIIACMSALRFSFYHCAFSKLRWKNMRLKALFALRQSSVLLDLVDSNVSELHSNYTREFGRPAFHYLHLYFIPSSHLYDIIMTFLCQK